MGSSPTSPTMLLVEIQDEKYFAKWAKELAAANRAKKELKLQAERELKREQDELDKLRRQKAREEERRLKGEAKKADLQKIAQIIDDAIGQAIPDGDPIDYILPRVRRMGYDGWDLTKILDKAARLLGSKSYYDRLADAWDDYIHDSAEPPHIPRPHAPIKPNKPELKQLYNLHSDPKSLQGIEAAKREHAAQMREYENKMKKYEIDRAAFEKKWKEYEPKLIKWREEQENPWRSSDSKKSRKR